MLDGTEAAWQVICQPPKMAREIKRLFTLHDVRVVDSDTIEAWVQVHRDVRLRWRIRLRGVEGGELGTATGARGTLALASHLERHAAAGLWLDDDGSTLDNHGRHVTDVTLPNGRSLTSTLLAGGTHWTRKRSTTEAQGETSYVQPSAE